MIKKANEENSIKYTNDFRASSYLKPKPYSKILIEFFFIFKTLYFKKKKKIQKIIQEVLQKILLLEIKRIILEVNKIKI